ncbi:hypothetical protein JCM5353_008002 [Sporobolomyces roseus]
MRLIDKHTKPGQPPKKRLVENSSFPLLPLPSGIRSVNYDLNPDEFPCSWTSFAEVQAFFHTYHDRKEVKFLGLDFRNGFEHIGVGLDARRRLCLYDEGYVWVREVAPYGLRTTPGEFGNLVDATKMIMRSKFPGRLDVINQVDDLSIAFVDPALEVEEVTGLLEELKWDLNEDKTQPLSRNPVHDGVEWDLDGCIMALPEEKRQKYYAKVVRVLNFGKDKGVPLQLTESLVGSLQYVCRILPHHRTHLRPLYRFRTSYTSDYRDATRQLDNSQLNCLEWWRVTLLERIQSSFSLPPPLFKGVFASDASNSSIGIWVQREQQDGSLEIPRYVKFDLSEDWRGKFEAYIGNAEAWAVETLVETLVKMGAKDCSLRLLCDNTNVVEAWSKGWSRNALLNLSIYRINQVASAFNLHIILQYIPSLENPSDPISRNDYPMNSLPLPPHHLPFPSPGCIGGSKPFSDCTTFTASLPP